VTIERPWVFLLRIDGVSPPVEALAALLLRLTINLYYITIQEHKEAE